MNNLAVKLSVAFGSSLIVAESVNVEPLINALITFGVSVVTVLTIEGVAWLRSFLKKKTKQNEDENEKDKK